MTDTTKTLGEIAELVRGRLQGDPQILISGASIIRDACQGEITLADNEELQKKLSASGASAVIIDSKFNAQIPAIVVENVHEAFAKVVSIFRPMSNHSTGRVSPHACVAASASIAAGASIHPRAVIGENVEIDSGVIVHSGAVIMDHCRIGKDTQIFPNAVLYERTVVGQRCLIHASAILGAYGFGYESSSGQHQLSAQLGYVLIENDVDIGAGTTIDRGTYGATRIGEGSKLDNQVMIGHNCSIGRHNLICSQVGIAGSCSTGDHVVMGGQVGIADHLHIGDGVMLGAKTGLMHDVTEKGVYLGAPCYPLRETMKQWAAVRRLPDTIREIKKLKSEIAKVAETPARSEQPAAELQSRDPKSKTSAA